MPSKTTDTFIPTAEERTNLGADPRWQLLRRIVLSRGMRRARDLQKILIFITELELIYPGCAVREQDIAQKVLGRREDFDPAYDTIVRVQVGHLRNKLEQYFAGEGAEEPVRLTIPKGSYLPVFESTSAPILPTTSESVYNTDAVLDRPDGLDAIPLPDISQNRVGTSSRRKIWYWAALAAILLCGAVFIALRERHSPSSAAETSTASEIVPFMAQHGEKVEVVLPDTSLLLVQKVLGLEIPLETYTQTSYPEVLSLQAKDPQLQKALQLLGRVRTTTLNEAEVGMDFLNMLNKEGMQGELRYARDLQIRDLGEGNYILIGNERSNPWVTLFTNQENFRWVGNPSDQQYLFQNMHPAPGEKAQYIHVDSPQETQNFVDITLTPNLTDSGYVLLIIGSDVPANEAAARFLLRGELPEPIETKLRQKNLRSIEILLRGHHFRGESNDKLEIVASRITMR